MLKDGSTGELADLQIKRGEGRLPGPTGNLRIIPFFCGAPPKKVKEKAHPRSGFAKKNLQKALDKGT